MTAFKDWAEIIDHLATALALIVAGFWTYKLFVQKRQKYQRTAVKHRISHRALGNGTLLLVVEVLIANTGDVLVAIEAGETTVKQLVPASAKIARKYGDGSAELPVRHQATGWALIAHEPQEPGRRGIEIEPGNTDQTVYNFVVAADVRCVQVYSYVENIQKRSWRINWRRHRLERHGRLGWHCTTTYDIHAPESHDSNSLPANTQTRRQADHVLEQRATTKVR